jgi:biopolymer transport protein ExbD
VKFKKKADASAAVPTGSMGDIVFLLLIFFMATTIFKLEDGLEVSLPRAESGIRVPRENVTHVWVDSRNDITIDDAYIQVENITQILVGKIRENPNLLVGLNMDANLPYQMTDLVLRQFRGANALNVSFTNDIENQ